MSWRPDFKFIESL